MLLQVIVLYLFGHHQQRLYAGGLKLTSKVHLRSAGPRFSKAVRFNHTVEGYSCREALGKAMVTAREKSKVTGGQIDLAGLPVPGGG